LLHLKAFHLENIHWFSVDFLKSIITVCGSDLNITSVVQLYFKVFLALASCVTLRIVNQVDSLNLSNIFICLSLSICFGHYVPIIRRDPIALTQLLYLSFCERSLVPIRMLYKLNADIIIIMCYIYTLKSTKLFQL
jgi:hypothetical protein